ncbi:hypothetical protein HAX54_044612 [Datura stramonium]|uniref:Pyridine nucleotide-disulphide oxidoreductase dimerisation domain-containing protein n=1 Tax=Datura stramonium TaxID=4076 RepID=A0ABS8SPY9_DATST|nr:hypothetical protein [Datura stramonium]
MAAVSPLLVLSPPMAVKPRLYDFDLFTIGAGSGGVRASLALILGLLLPFVSFLSPLYLLIPLAALVARACFVDVISKKLLYASKYSHEFEESCGFGWNYEAEPKHDWSTLIANKNAEAAPHGLGILLVNRCHLREFEFHTEESCHVKSADGSLSLKTNRGTVEVFSQPPIGLVGLTEEQAIKEYGDIDVYTANFRPLKATLSGLPDRVFMKLIVCAKSGKVLGLHMCGEDAPEIVQGFGGCSQSRADQSDSMPLWVFTLQQQRSLSPCEPLQGRFEAVHLRVRQSMTLKLQQEFDNLGLDTVKENLDKRMEPLVSMEYVILVMPYRLLDNNLSESAYEVFLACMVCSGLEFRLTEGTKKEKSPRFLAGLKRREKTFMVLIWSVSLKLSGQKRRQVIIVFVLIFYILLLTLPTPCNLKPVLEEGFLLTSKKLYLSLPVAAFMQ